MRFISNLLFGNVSCYNRERKGNVKIEIPRGGSAERAAPGAGLPPGEPERRPPG
jgi:hypothetical protein